MSKGMKNILIVVVIALLIFAILFAVYGHFKTEPMNANTSKENILGDANTGLENLLENIFDDENTANEQNNTEVNQENTTNTNTNTTTNTSANSNKNQTSTSGQEENSMTPKETKATNLAKKKWLKDMGSEENVTFTVSIQNDGKYLVSAYDNASMRLVLSYVVDVDTETVTER